MESKNAHLELLERLVGEQLSSVVFVQNYLQLDFDGRRLTLNVWPELVLDGEVMVFGECGYRDRLCAFIAKKVEHVEENEDEIRLLFSTDCLRIDLTAAVDQVLEKVVFDDTIDGAWGWW